MSQFASSILFSIDTALQLNGGVNKETITTTKTLTYRDSTVQLITPSGGSKTVKLPALKGGVQFLIANLDPSNTLKVWTPTDVELVTLAANSSSTPVGSSCLCWCDGSVWTCITIISHIGFSA